MLRLGSAAGIRGPYRVELAVWRHWPQRSLLRWSSGRRGRAQREHCARRAAEPGGHLCGHVLKSPLASSEPGGALAGEAGGGPWPCHGADCNSSKGRRPTIEAGLFLLQACEPHKTVFHDIARDERLLGAESTKTLPDWQSIRLQASTRPCWGAAGATAGGTQRCSSLPSQSWISSSPRLQSSSPQWLPYSPEATSSSALPRTATLVPEGQAMKPLLTQAQVEEKLAHIRDVPVVVLEPHAFQPYESFLSRLIPPSAHCQGGHSPGASGACVSPDYRGRGEHHLSAFQESCKGSPGTAVSALHQGGVPVSRAASPCLHGGSPVFLLEGVCESNHPVLHRGHKREAGGRGSRGPVLGAQDDAMVDARSIRMGGPVGVPEPVQASPSGGGPIPCL